MFKHIQVDGLGPFAGTNRQEVQPGISTIVAPSMSGKSSIIDAVCFCLFGTDSRGRPLPVEQINDDCDAVGVELTTRAGAILSRSMDRSRRTTRSLYTPGDDINLRFKTEKEWRSHALKALGRELPAGRGSIPAARLVMAPFAWEGLLEQEGGRGLRDVIDAVCGGGDLRPIVAGLMSDAGYELKDEDPVRLQSVEAMRTEAKRAQEAQYGALQAARRAGVAAREAAPKPAPTEDEIAAARAVLADLTTWEQHDAAVEAFEAEADDAAVSAWQEKRNALGVVEAVTPAQISKAEAEITPAESRVRGFEQTLAKITGQIEAHQIFDEDDIKSRLLRYEQNEGCCPECGRKWAKAAKIIAELRRQLAQGENKPSATLADLGQEKDRLSREVELAKKALDRKRAALDRLKLAQVAHQQWKSDVAELGPRPGSSQEPPPAPDLDRPTADQVSEARSLLERNGHAEGAAEEHRAQVQRAEDTVVLENKSLAKAQAHLDRCRALVDAVRQAPNQRLMTSIKTLDTHPVSFKLKDNGFEAYIDGRPRWLASTGRRIYADLKLRLALRRALGMVWLPVFVDNVQAWSEDWPASAINGRQTDIVMLRTEAR